MFRVGKVEESRKSNRVVALSKLVPAVSKSLMTEGIILENIIIRKTLKL